MTKAEILSNLKEKKAEAFSKMITLAYATEDYKMLIEILKSEGNKIEKWLIDREKELYKE